MSVALPLSVLAPPGDSLASAVLTTLGISAAAVLASLPFGLALAWFLARRRFPGKALVETLVATPLVLPPVVTGVLLLLVLGRSTAFGGWLTSTFGIDIVFTPTAAVLAAAIVAFPLLVRTARVAFEGVDRELEQAARSMGASPVRVWSTVTLPLARRGVTAAVVLAFARAVGEFGATLVVAGTLPGGRRTLSVEVWQRLQSGDPGRAVPFVVASVLLAFAAVGWGEWLARPRRQHDGRRRP